jgi:hypothetical protein
VIEFGENSLTIELDAAKLCVDTYESETSEAFGGHYLAESIADALVHSWVGLSNKS